MTQHAEGFYDGNTTLPRRITTGMSGRMRKVHVTTVKGGTPVTVYRTGSLASDGASSDYEGGVGDPAAITFSGADFILGTKEVNTPGTRFYWEGWAD